MKKTKTDWRIMGKPYRGARRVMAIITGLLSETEAEQKLKEGIEGGWLSPEAYVRSQTVGDEFVGEDSTADIRAEINDSKSRC